MKVESSQGRAGVICIEEHPHYSCLPSCLLGFPAYTGLCNTNKLNLNICRALIGQIFGAAGSHWSTARRQWRTNV